jgi:hypothetical protein
MNTISWEKLKEMLLKELRKTKHILTFGTIGSLDTKKDIDVIITKKPAAKTSDFYKEIHQLFESVDKTLKEQEGLRAFRFYHSIEESVLRYFNSNKGIYFHTMVYTSYPQIERDWKWAMFEDESIKEILGKHYNCLLGNVKELFSKEFQKKKYYDSMFIYLYQYDKINSNYPKVLFLEMMNNSFDFLFRKRLKLEVNEVGNEKEAKETFYKLCDTLDKLEANRK